MTPVTAHGVQVTVHKTAEDTGRDLTGFYTQDTGIYIQDTGLHI